MSKIKWKHEQKSNPKVKTVKVSNVSPGASEQDIKDFFSFSGDIEYVEMQSGNERSQIAYVTFSDSQGVETAILLSGETIVDLAVHITPASEYELPPAASIPPAALIPPAIGEDGPEDSMKHPVLNGTRYDFGAHQQPSTSSAPSCSNVTWTRREGKQHIEEEKEEEEKEEEKEEEEEEEEKEEEKEEEEEEKEEEAKERKRSLWTVSRTVTLLDEWEKQGKKKFTIADWLQLGVTLTSLLGITFNGRQCSNKIHSLKKDFAMRMGSGTAAKKWEYYEKMNSLMEKGLLTFHNKIEKKPERREKIEKKQERRKKVEKKIEKSEEERQFENLDNLLSVEEKVKTLREMVLNMASRVKSSPPKPFLVESSGEAAAWYWNSQSMSELIELGKKKIGGLVECKECGSERSLELDWRLGFLNVAGYILGKLYSGGAEAAAKAAAEFNGPSCSICKAEERPVSSGYGYDWLFVALSQTVQCIPNTQQALVDYLTAQKVKVSSETSPEKLLLKFYVYMFTQLDPMNGWDVMRV